jgi:Uma2 family endonuclease
MSLDAQLHLREWRMSVEAYFTMGEAGILGEDDRVELLDGRLIDMPPIGPPHGHSVDDFEGLFARRLYKPKDTLARVRVQNPIQLDDSDVVLYNPDMPRDRHLRPEDIYLVVEVADSSVDYDPNVKAQHYAAAGVGEYWLVDLANEFVDVFRRPEDDGYADRSWHRAGDRLSISALPDVEPVPVDSIL